LGCYSQRLRCEAFSVLRWTYRAGFLSGRSCLGEDVRSDEEEEEDPW
jgi:hypothetical protein